MYDYQSEYTKFMNEHLKENPQEAEQRIKNRGILWDVSLDAKEQEDFKSASVPRGSYAYQSE